MKTGNRYVSEYNNTFLTSRSFLPLWLRKEIMFKFINKPQHWDGIADNLNLASDSYISSQTEAFEMGRPDHLGT